MLSFLFFVAGEVYQGPKSYVQVCYVVNNFTFNSFVINICNSCGLTICTHIYKGEVFYQNYFLDRYESLSKLLYGKFVMVDK